MDLIIENGEKVIVNDDKKYVQTPEENKYSCKGCAFNTKAGFYCDIDNIDDKDCSMNDTIFVLCEGEPAPHIFKIGDVFYLSKGPGKPYKCHVRGFVDDQVIYRWYGRHKQWWHYELEHYDTLTWKIERNKKS